MAAVNSSAAAGILLVVAGVWVLLQTLVGGLVQRILALGASAAASGTGASAAPSGIAGTGVAGAGGAGSSSAVPSGTGTGAVAGPGTLGSFGGPTQVYPGGAPASTSA